MHHFIVAHVQRDKGGTPYSEDRYCASQQTREKPLSLYYDLKFHALGQQKNQIGVAQVWHRNSVSVYPTDVSWK